MAGVRWEIWVASDVAKRLREAAETLHLLPMNGNDMPAGFRSTMPDPVRNFWEMWNQLTAAEREERARDFNRTRVFPTNSQITQMEEALAWLLWLDERDRRVVMAKASKSPYRKISYFDGRSRELLRQVWVRSCDSIAVRLNITNLDTKR